MKTIKFRRAHFKDEETKQFSHYSYWGVNLSEGNVFTSPSCNNYAPYFIDEQFTGLVDKNGKEIYEGDVVKYNAYNDTDHMICVVQYSHSYFKLQRTDDLQRSWFAWAPLSVEVIGNIHENPELLTIKEQ